MGKRLACTEPVEYHESVIWIRERALLSFLMFSLCLHFSVLFFWPKLTQLKREETIPVTLSPTVEEKPERSKASETASERRPATKSSSASRTSAKEKLAVPAKTLSKPNSEPPRTAAAKEAEVQKEEPKKSKSIELRERPLPGLKELLPSPWSLASRNDDAEPISLNTNEPEYVSYFRSIKRAIEAVWDYPPEALKQGMEGKLFLEFIVLRNGEVERTELIRSSGHSVLDQEAVRAVKAASPFRSIPPWIKRNRLPIVASFEYHDKRLHYSLAP